ncbi:MAG: hypothetical protein WAL32_07470 [Terriglobales bacterium]
MNSAAREISAAVGELLRAAGNLSDQAETPKASVQHLLQMIKVED